MCKKIEMKLKKDTGEAEVASIHFEICEYRNVRGYQCKKIEVELRPNNPVRSCGKSNR
jgi:hypothetical protein